MAWRPCRSCSLRSRFPRVAPGGFCALCRSLRASDKGSVATLPASRPCARPRFRPCALAPSGAVAGGGGFGVPSRPCGPLPAGLPPAPCGGGVGGSLRSPVWLCGGVSWFVFACLAVPASFRWFPWRCVRPAVGSRRGAVRPWGCRSAVRGARCPGLSRSRGFPRSPPRRASRGRGVGGFPLAPAFAPCVRCRAVLRFPCRFAGACRRAGRGCAPWWPLGAALPLPLSLSWGVACGFFRFRRFRSRCSCRRSRCFAVFPRSRRCPFLLALPRSFGSSFAPCPLARFPSGSVGRCFCRGWFAGSAAGRSGSAWPRALGSPVGVLLPVPQRLAVRSLPLFPASAPAVVGFSGSRRLLSAFAPLVAGVVGAALAGGRSVAVGCAPGADAFVRSAAPGALVFSAAAFGSGRGAFAARSVALVRAVAAGGPGSGFVVFPASPCPAGLSPSARSSACFCGSGSGSWASAAFAAGLGLPLVVFPCGFSALPSWGSWVPAGSGVWAAGFRLVR